MEKGRQIIIVIFAILPLSASVAFLNVSLVFVGRIAPIGFGSIPYLGPAFSVATENVQKKYNSTMRFSIEYLYNRNYPTCPDLGYNAVGMVSEWHYCKRKESDLTVYIIPACVETTEMPYFQAQWNTLWINTMSASNSIRNRQLYPNWIGTNYFPHTVTSELYIEILNKYGWTTTFFVLDKTSPSFYFLLCDNILDDLKRYPNSKQTVVRISGTTDTYFNFKQEMHFDFGQTLNDIRKTSRVVLFFGHAAFFREFMISAARMNMTNGEYVYIAVEPMHNKLYGLLHWSYNDSNDHIAFQAFQSVIIVHPRDINSPPHPYLGPEFAKRSRSDYNLTYSLADQPFITLVDTYQAVTALGQVLNDSIMDGTLLTDRRGATLAKYFLNRTFTDDDGGGTLYIDSEGQKRSDLNVSHFTPFGEIEPFLQKIARTQALVELVPLKTWVNSSFPPPNEPDCGYSHQKLACQPSRDTIYNSLYAILAAVFVVAVVSWISVGHINRKTAERLLLDPWWQVTLSTFVCSSRYLSGASSMFSVGPNRRYKHKAPDCIPDITNVENNVPITTLAAYQGKPVTVTGICHRNSSITFCDLSENRTFLKFIKKFYELDNPNVCRFFGLSIIGRAVGSYTIAAVTEWASRGSLPDIFNTVITNDFGLASSLIVDFLEALRFIHSSRLRYHGRISILACWIDKHFTLKLANLASNRLGTELCRSYEHLKGVIQTNLTESLYWMTPESPDRTDVSAMQSADIYTSGLIIYEILTKGKLYTQLEAMKRDVLQDLVSRKGSNTLLELTHFGDLPKFEKVLRSCWNPNHVQRPSIHGLRSRISEISPLLVSESNDVKLVDTFIKRLADYASNLEREVAVRTASLNEEKRKCDDIIGQFLPRTIVRQMRAGLNLQAELFDCVTIMFTDLFGFHEFVITNSPETTISLIGETETCFDLLTTKYDVYKVEAVGDSFVVASGLPTRIGIEHVQRIGLFAVKLMESESSLTCLKNLRWKIGIHSGSCAAGVLGSKRPRYCIFGDTINMASRMCSHGLPGAIHLSPIFKELLENFANFFVEPRGVMAIKGKSEMLTYWLKGC